MTSKVSRIHVPESNFQVVAVVLIVLLAFSATSAYGQYVQGEATVGKNTTTPAPSQMFIDATQFLVTDMCDAITTACSKLNATSTTYPAGATIDARGFTGNQVCSASTITKMLFKCVPQGSSTGATSGKLLLGEVNLYADGPLAGAGGNYSDGTSGIGTPALIIPSFFWGIEGVSRGASAGTTGTHPPAGPGTFLSVCTGNGTPVDSSNAATGSPICHNSFPVRSFPILTTNVVGNTMTITLSGSLTSGTNVYPAELAMVKGSDTVNENGTYKIQSITNGASGAVTVTVPSGTGVCHAPQNCGTLYLGTPILGFANSNNAYNDPVCFAQLCSGFGQHIKNLGFNCQGAGLQPAGDIEGCIGWQNLYAEEEGGADPFLVSNFNFVGVDIHGGPKNGTQNFGPVLNAEILTGANNVNCDFGTTGIYIGDSQMRGLNGWTINQSAESPNPTPFCNNRPNNAILFDAPNTEVSNGHCEGFTNCILMGANNAPGGGAIGASSQKISTIAGGPVCALGTTCNVVHISNNYPNNTDYTIQNARRNNFTNTIQDDVNGITLGNGNNDTFTALYTWASGVNNTPSTTTTNILTTDPSTTNQFGSGVKAATYGTTLNCASATGSCGSGSFAAGRVTIATGAPTVTVSTMAVTASSEIYVQEDATLGLALGVTCNITGGRTYTVTARTAGTSFVITANIAPATHPACLSFHIVN